MNKQQYAKAAKLDKAIEAKKTELRLFQNGKITGLSVRLFNEEKTIYEDRQYTTNLPCAKLKGAMLEQLTTQLQLLEYQYEQLFTE